MKAWGYIPGLQNLAKLSDYVIAKIGMAWSAGDLTLLFETVSMIHNS
jgi:hypothetical protein